MTLYFEEEGGIKLPLECETLAKKVVCLLYTSDAADE